MADVVDFCAVIPAAGHGTRLGLGVPKILLEIADGTTVWHLLHRRLSPVVAHTHVVVSPTTEATFRQTAGSSGTTVSVQDHPRGMGDAIFGAEAYWRGYDAILVVWGDQANLSATTVERVVATHRRGGGRRLTLPLVSMPDPYVEYELEPGGLIRVRQSREGDACTPGGLSDVGVFCLSTDGLTEAWEKYLTEAPVGATTGEVNFLPFLPYLSQVEGWAVDVLRVADAAEARGVNTLEDLEFARRSYLGLPT